MRGGDVWARRDAPATPYENRLALAVADPAQLLVVGTIDDAVVGYAVAATEVLGVGSLLARLTDLYAEPEAREVGVGEKLLDYVIESRRTRP